MIFVLRGTFLSLKYTLCYELAVYSHSYVLPHCCQPPTGIRPVVSSESDQRPEPELLPFQFLLRRPEYLHHHHLLFLLLLFAVHVSGDVRKCRTQHCQALGRRVHVESVVGVLVTGD